MEVIRPWALGSEEAGLLWEMFSIVTVIETKRSHEEQCNGERRKANEMKFQGFKELPECAFIYAYACMYVGELDR